MYLLAKCEGQHTKNTENVQSLVYISKNINENLLNK